VIGGCIAALVIVLDQSSKAWAAATLPAGGGQVVGVPDWLWFRLLRNTGATFSLLGDYNLLFAAATLLVLLAIWLVLQRGYLADRLSVVALGAVAGGAGGNLVDRVRLGGVVDFIHVRLWPTYFNLADVAVRLGVLTILARIAIDLLARRRRAA
jgi:signal peptidase II